MYWQTFALLNSLAARNPAVSAWAERVASFTACINPSLPLLVIAVQFVLALRAGKPGRAFTRAHP